MSDGSRDDIVRDPHLLCRRCGFANLRLTDEGALCTECGTRYLQPGTEESQ